MSRSTFKQNYPHVWSLAVHLAAAVAVGTPLGFLIGWAAAR